MRSYLHLLATSIILQSLLSLNVWFFVQSLSSPPSNGGDGLTTLSDRFRCSCPAPLSSIRLFDSSLGRDKASKENKSAIWAAVYRSNQNQPSVFVRDEFLNAMKNAIEPVQTSTTSSPDATGEKSWSSSLLETPESSQVPIAVACLRPSLDHGDGCMVLDTLRCVLKKENMDPSCDGGSEHTEAISTAIDSLILQHLSSSSSDSSQVRFEKAIRAKTTLISGKLLEMRGFEPIDDQLQLDMATHLSSLDACLEKYAERSVNANNMAKSPGAQQRALSIVSCLARLDREADMQAAAEAQAAQDEESRNNGGGDEYDPWSGVTRFI